jgi:hypothetical protein
MNWFCHLFLFRDLHKILTNIAGCTEYLTMNFDWSIISIIFIQLAQMRGKYANVGRRQGTLFYRQHGRGYLL